MEVILRREVEKLGKAGDLVSVAPGYARNYLLPQDFAVTVNKQNAELIQKEQERLVQEEKSRVDEVRDIGIKLAETSITLTEKASPEGHLYGSVGPKQIAEALRKEGFEIDPKMVLLDEPIKELNVYDIKIRLHNDVEPACKVWVVSESE